MKRAAQVAASLVGLVLVIVGVALLALWASGALAAVQVSGTPEPSPAATSVAAGPAQHEVVVSVSGAPGTQFRVVGEVFGDTGPIDLPESGGDSAHFQTAKAADELDLAVYVAAPIGDTTVGCAITYDGNEIASTERVPLEHTNTVVCRVKPAATT